jgi:1-deoxy-D-xylulose-5-phosphate reductoisomerase
MTRRVAILGSTGSIGTQALDVIARNPDRFVVSGLAAGRNVDLLREQVQRFAPEIATTAADGPDALRRVAVDSRPDIVLAATDGAVAFDAVFAAVERGIDIAVANKELIVAAGELLMAAAAVSGARILPVDSEHSAIFQCLVGEDAASVAAIVLTASGGPFWRLSVDEMRDVTLASALQHPTWRMGVKNTIDSASLMNKGLEVIEASRLFGVSGERLKVVVHRQSIAHGFVLFTDGSVKGQLCAPDMRVPIGYALAYPNRLASLGDPKGFTGAAPFDELGAARPPSAEPLGSPNNRLGHADPVILSLSKDQGTSVLSLLGGKPQDAPLRYDFEEPDFQRFPCLGLAYAALDRGGVAPAVLSAANEVAVTAFVEGRIGFMRIAEVIEATLAAVPQRDASLAGIREADNEARVAAARAVEDVKTTW